MRFQSVLLSLLLVVLLCTCTMTVLVGCGFLAPDAAAEIADRRPAGTQAATIGMRPSE